MSALDRFYDLLNHDGDPFRQHPDNLRELQLAAMRERFAQRREQIKLLGRRAADMGVDEIRSEADMVPLLFAHQIYKSYPEQFIENGRWKHLNTWLQTLASRPVTDVDLESEREIIATLQGAFPTHSILGEEGGSRAGSEINTHSDLASLHILAGNPADDDSDHNDDEVGHVFFS